jgi:inward rectifier potassium channel
MASRHPKPSDPAPYARMVPRNRRDRRRNAPIIAGRDQGFWADLYLALLSAPWWAFLGGLAVLYVVINTLFALLYLLDPGGISNARPGSFWDAFFFSVQTFATLGYGVFAPKSFYANMLVTVEAFAGVLNIALASGTMFARVSRPTARVMFSRSAVIVPFEGTPTFMFRVANQRGNSIMEAEVTLSLVRQTVTREGHIMRRFEELRLTRARTPLFALSWTVMHPIDEASPFNGATRQSLLNDEVEIVVVLSGTDETYSEKIYARHSYMPHDIHWNKKFANIIGRAASGRLTVDLNRFHAIEDLAPERA